MSRPLATRPWLRLAVAGVLLFAAGVAVGLVMAASAQPLVKGILLVVTVLLLLPGIAALMGAYYLWRGSRPEGG